MALAPSMQPSRLVSPAPARSLTPFVPVGQKAWRYNAGCARSSAVASAGPGESKGHSARTCWAGCRPHCSRGQRGAHLARAAQESQGTSWMDMPESTPLPEDVIVLPRLKEKAPYRWGGAAGLEAKGWQSVCLILYSKSHASLFLSPQVVGRGPGGLL